MNTLWESICSLSGETGTNEIQLSEAVEKSAVPDIVARAEVRRMVEDGLLELVGSEDVVRLSERGRRSCVDTKQGVQLNGLLPPQQ